MRSNQSLIIHLLIALNLFFSSFLSADSTPTSSPPSTTKPNPYWEARRKAREAGAGGTEKKRPVWVDWHERSKKFSQDNLLKGKLSHDNTFQKWTEGVYTFPGVVINKEDGWQGSDNIYKVGKNIAVAAELNLTDPQSFPLTKQNIIHRVESIFQEGGLNPQAPFLLGKPPLPLLNIVILAQPIDKGYAVFVEGNLLEEVELKRARLTEGSWQAITWERQYLLVSSNEELVYHINRAIDELAFSFLKLHRYYAAQEKEKD